MGKSMIEGNSNKLICISIYLIKTKVDFILQLNVI